MAAQRKPLIKNNVNEVSKLKTNFISLLSLL